MHESGEWAADQIPGLVRRIRRTARLSQRQLADRLGLAKSTIARPYADPFPGDWHTETDSLDASWWRDRQEARARGEVKISFHRRANSRTPEERDALGLPDDHPTYDELVEAMEVRELAMELRRELLARRRAEYMGSGETGHDDDSEQK